MEIFYGTAIQGARDRSERAHIHIALIDLMKREGHHVISEHTSGRTSEETAQLLERSIGPLPSPGIGRTIYVRNKMIELVESDIGAAVFEVSVVRKQAKGIFALLYDLGDDEWSYDFADEGGDGILEIRFGPRADKGIKPQVTYRWDPKTRTYVGPKGSPGDHFRVIDPTDIWDELERLKQERLIFPNPEKRK